MLCLVVEAPGTGGELPPLTESHPAATIDLLGEPGPDERKTRTALLLVRGAPAPAIEDFVAELATRHPPVTTLRREPGLWFGRATFHMARLHTPSAQALGPLFALVGPPWVHLEHGVAHLRARVKDPTQVEDLVHLAEERLAAAGVEAQAAAQEVGPRDLSVWEDLVRHTIGLTL